MQIKKQIKYVLALLLVVFPTMALAASVTLRWQANQEPDISSYNVYYGTQSRNYGLPIPAGKVTSYTVDELTEGATYYFALTAVDTSGNESGYSSEVVANATSSEPATEDYQLLLSYNSNRSNAVKLDGQTISGNVYIFLDPEANVSQVVFSIDGQIHNTENYAPYDLGVPFNSSTLTNGTHTISALIRHQDDTTETISATLSASNTESNPPDSETSEPALDFTTPITGIDWVTDVQSPQRWGRTVQITAQAVGGTGQYEYQFRIKNQVVQDFSTANSFSWDTTNYEGNNLIDVRVRNAGSSRNWQKRKYARFKIHKRDAPPKKILVSTDFDSPQAAGQTVTITADAEGDTGDYEYCFFINNILVQDYSTVNTYYWNTSNYTGINRIKVWTRNVLSDKKSQKRRTILYRIQ